jgi:RNA polymerase sporulation-specific sigma factor
MSRTAHSRSSGSDAQVWVEVHDRLLVDRYRAGDHSALDLLFERYRGFVRLKANTYFLAGGDTEDLMQEGLLGLFKAVRDYRSDREASFRSFAELCVERQMITAIKTAARKKHGPLNTCVSFSHTRSGSSGGDREMTLAEILPTDPVVDPVNQAISAEEL